MAGWLLQDSGKLNAAASWSRQAYMLIRQANIAALADDHADVVQLAAARRIPGPLDPKLIALALQQQARSRVRLGEHRDCFTLLDQAADTLREHPDVTDQDASVYLHHYDLRTLTEQSAACYQAAGRADVAVAILEDTIAATGSALARDRGHLTSKLPSPSPARPSPTRHEQPASACKPSASPAIPARPASCANLALSTRSSPSAGPAIRQAAPSATHSPHRPPIHGCQLR